MHVYFQYTYKRARQRHAAWDMRNWCWARPRSLRSLWLYLFFFFFYYLFHIFFFLYIHIYLHLARSLLLVVWGKEGRYMARPSWLLTVAAARGERRLNIIDFNSALALYRYKYMYVYVCEYNFDEGNCHVVISERINLLLICIFFYFFFYIFKFFLNPRSIDCEHYCCIRDKLMGNKNYNTCIEAFIWIDQIIVWCKWL